MSESFLAQLLVIIILLTMVAMVVGVRRSIRARLRTYDPWLESSH